MTQKAMVYGIIMYAINARIKQKLLRYGIG